MKKTEFPMTSAVRVLKNNKIDFTPHIYDYVEHGGTSIAATSLNVPEYNVIKTLVMETDQHKPLIVLMHGVYEVSTKQLARIIGVKHVETANASSAQKYTGYIFGGISPIGARTKLPIYAEKTIFQLDKIYLNGGKRGFLIEINPKDLKKILQITEVEIAINIK